MKRICEGSLHSNKRRRVNVLKPPLLSSIDDGAALSEGVTFGLRRQTSKGVHILFCPVLDHTNLAIPSAVV